MHWPAECVVVIPCLNEEAAVSSLVMTLGRQGFQVIVVDDGSKDATAARASNAGAEVVRHKSTRGKGAALDTGWRRAVQRGFAWTLNMDGDGQHAAEDIPAFLSAAERRKVDLVVGNRLANPDHMPWLRRQVNQWMSRRLSHLTGLHLPDSQCGFRLMRLAAWSALSLEAGHFEVESETLLAFIAAGHAVDFVPVRTIYKNERSKINPLLDAWRWFKWWRHALGRPHGAKSGRAISACAPRA